MSRGVSRRLGYSCIFSPRTSRGLLLSFLHRMYVYVRGGMPETARPPPPSLTLSSPSDRGVRPHRIVIDSCIVHRFDCNDMYVLFVSVVSRQIFSSIIGTGSCSVHEKLNTDQLTQNAQMQTPGPQPPRTPTAALRVSIRRHHHHLPTLKLTDESDSEPRARRLSSTVWLGAS